MTTLYEQGVDTVQGLLAFLTSLLNLSSFLLFCVYLIIAWLAPAWRQGTSPLECRKLLIVYNFSLTILSTYTMLGFLRGLWEAGDLFGRQTNPILQHIFYMYFLSKVFELLDTVFMILRHKERQVTFLHVFHHSSMLLFGDFTASVVPWPAIAPFLCTNSFVHIIMYSYYGLTALDPLNPPTWKRQVTHVQLVQFIVLLFHSLYGWMYHGFCIYGAVYALIMICLFSQFYLGTYVKKEHEHKD